MIAETCDDGRSVQRLPMADQQIASIDVADIAAVAVAVRVLAGMGHQNQTYQITGPRR